MATALLERRISPTPTEARSFGDVVKGQTRSLAISHVQEIAEITGGDIRGVVNHPGLYVFDNGHRITINVNHKDAPKVEIEFEGFPEDKTFKTEGNHIRIGEDKTSLRDTQTTLDRVNGNVTFARYTDKGEPEHIITISKDSIILPDRK